MDRATSRILILLLTAVGLTGTVIGQTQTQNQSIWQKIKNSAKQSGQNTAQQGSQQVQQGVQQGVGAVGNQVMGGQQSPCGSLNGAGNGTLTNAAFNGGGGNAGAGSCGPTCFNAGPFAAAVSQMTMSQQGGYHIIRMEVQFHNATNQPLAIAYHEGSMTMVDENGNAYQGAGGNPGEVQGMGIDRGSQTDPQFVLGPGQTGSAMFAVARYRPNTSPIGTAYNYNFTIDELQAQNGAEAIVARQYNLNFPTLAPGTASGGLPAGAPVNGFASPTGGGTTGVANGSSTGFATNGAVPSRAASRTAVPAQTNAVNARSAVARTGAATTGQGAVSNAALKSTAVGTKPGTPVKAVPTKKTTTTTDSTTSR